MSGLAGVERTVLPVCVGIRRRCGVTCAADARAAEGESPEALRAALHKQNELVRTLRSSLTLMAQDYTDVRCENERLRSDLGLAPVGELGSAL